MMTARKAKLILASNPNIIEDILLDLGCHGISITEGKRIQFGCQDNSSRRSHCLFLDEFLTHKDYPNDITENFIEMVCRMRKISYDDCLGYIALFITGDIRSPLEASNNNSSYRDKPLDVYSNEYLESYPKIISELFLKDGISVSSQNKYDVRFSEKNNRVLLPIFQKDKLVGIFGRYNEKIPSNDDIPKWFPLLPYQKGKVLFPFDINKRYISKTKTCFLVESEKTPMLCSKWNWNNILALGGSSISSAQLDLLKEIGVERVILCLDKGLSDDVSQFLSIRIQEYGFKTYYIDSNSIEYLPNKECVFDLNDKELISETIKKYIKAV